ncbi:hypothetical protein F5887DRAFT_475680 [Amanita rubescens]|nr:hypothetical protein F5887DRAFT_475680 [Amanita rubescens]
MIPYVFQWLQVLVVSPVSVSAQGSISSHTPKCTNVHYNWTFNSMGQSPCYVADALMDQCLGQMYTIIPLSVPGDSYEFPENFLNATCSCNTVWYSLLSACAICQNGSWITWQSYSQYCNQTYLMQYPGHIPSNTSVPSWAYMNLTKTGDDFDPVAASNLAVGSSSTASASFTSITSTLASTSTSALSESNSPSVRLSKAKAGAIAGGAIGCAIGGALILVLLFWLYKKCRTSPPDPGTSPQTSEHKIMDPPSSTGLTPVPSPPPSTNGLQQRNDPDDIPTSSTIPRFRYEGPRGLLPNTEHHWGQIGQYYADLPEL